MFPKYHPNKPDPFAILILIVTVGVSVTVIFQLRMYDINHFLNVRSAQNISPFTWNYNHIPSANNFSSNFRER